MANTNAPFGLRLLGLNNAPATPSFGFERRKIAQADTVKAYRGDPMLNLTTGYVRAATGGAGSAASTYAGIFWGCSYLSVAQGKRIVTPYWPGADAAGDVDVQLIPLIGSTPGLFVAQATSTQFAFEDIGENVDIAYAAGTAIGGLVKSGVTLAQSTLGTANTLPFRIRDLWSAQSAPGTPGTDDSSNYNWVVVSFNSQAETGNA